MKNKKQIFFSLFIALLTLFFDQISKFIVKKNIYFLASGIDVFNGLNLVYVENKGVSFGLLSEYNIPFFLGILSLSISIYILYLVYQSTSKLEILGLSFILGGALGNGFDRLLIGYVVDFIDIYYGEFHWPAFNLADTFITIGAILFFLNIFKKK